MQFIKFHRSTGNTKTVLHNLKVMKRKKIKNLFGLLIIATQVYFSIGGGFSEPVRDGKQSGSALIDPAP